MADETDDGDRVEFRWVRHWRAKADTGGEHCYGRTLYRKGAAALNEARGAHHDDLLGGWVEPGMLAPHVSSLRVFSQGRMLPEELAPKGDCSEAAEQMPL